jgi:hypothetical protein
MFQPDANQWPMGFFHTVLPLHFTGGVAPSRHEVALATYLEKQAAHCEAAAALRQFLSIVATWSRQSGSPPRRSVPRKRCKFAGLRYGKDLENAETVNSGLSANVFLTCSAASSLCPNAPWHAAR